eukprot:CAMPEP_0118696100 /NCGR_PEP_ID=MMETSP0800-20121206/13626_1 /TAXON_ID=210618 ORGANISM="Striatella unipunctata, Strain CCMP2910" /NCGR_SAMPLE_ID=MMETSP0800 /ASSEMBLY_ACC=CAM_ASM_000638 /LENGTH=289 /DNA_ID=CAMNT_0006595109 /DNA_START=99 /DNA_END=968 /DNA_ORIENTATION=+
MDEFLCDWQEEDDNDDDDMIDPSSTLLSKSNSSSRWFSSSEVSPLLATKHSADDLIAVSRHASCNHAASRVCESLDVALMLAEDMLVARHNPSLLLRDGIGKSLYGKASLSLSQQQGLGCISEIDLDQEHEIACNQMAAILRGEGRHSVEKLFALMTREVYHKGDVVWNTGDPGDCAKLIVRGDLLSTLVDTSLSSLSSTLSSTSASTEEIVEGNFVGEFGLCHENMNRLTNLCCFSNQAVLYSLSKDAWKNEMDHELKCIFYKVVVRYLAHRVQHVSNRIFETKCLPV